MNRTLTIWLLILGWIMLSGCSTNQSAVQSPIGQEPAGNSQPIVRQAAAGNPNNGKPIVVPAATPLLGGVPLLVHFWDNGSYDPDGDQLVNWEWNFADEEEGQGGWHDYTATQGNAWHTYSSAGTYTAHLRITDSTGRKGIGHIQIVLADGLNANPIAIAGANPLSGDAPLEVSFSAQGSYDPDGTIAKYEWDFGTGIFLDYTSSQGKVSTTYGSGGLYTAILRITDDDGAIATDSVAVEVNSPPTAVASASPTSGTAPLTVHFSAQGSYDPDGVIVSYEWDFGEGGGFQDFTSIQGETDHIYTQVNSYTATLRVMDDWGKTVTAGVEIEVLEPSARGDWWMFGREPTHNRRSPFVGPQTPTLQWRYSTGFWTTSSPAVAADGTIYVGSWDYYLHALNPDGSAKWRYLMGSAIDYSSPAIATDGTIYIGNWDRYIYAINPDGTLKWRYPTSDAIYSSPVIAPDGTIYIGSDDRWIYAINTDGTLKWSYLTGERVRSSPALDSDGTVYVGSDDGYLYAIKADGSLKWRYKTNGQLRASPAIAIDGTIYIGSYDYYFYAINADGSLKWKIFTGYIVDSSAALDKDGTIYFGTNFYGIFNALNPDGTIKWQFQAGLAYIISSPAIGADGTIYVGSKDCHFYAIRPDGTLKWQYFVGHEVSSSPAIGANGAVYFTSRDYYLYAFKD